MQFTRRAGGETRSRRAPIFCSVAAFADARISADCSRVCSRTRSPRFCRSRSHNFSSSCGGICPSDTSKRFCLAWRASFSCSSATSACSGPDKFGKDASQTVVGELLLDLFENGLRELWGEPAALYTTRRRRRVLPGLLGAAGAALPVLANRRERIPVPRSCRAGRALRPAVQACPSDPMGRQATTWAVALRPSLCS